MVAELSAHGFHVVTYDVRGTGSSGVPAGRAGYRCDVLVDGSPHWSGNTCDGVPRLRPEP